MVQDMNDERNPKSEPYGSFTLVFRGKPHASLEPKNAKARQTQNEVRQSHIPSSILAKRPSAADQLPPAKRRNISTVQDKRLKRLPMDSTIKRQTDDLCPVVNGLKKISAWRAASINEFYDGLPANNFSDGAPVRRVMHTGGFYDRTSARGAAPADERSNINSTRGKLRRQQNCPCKGQSYTRLCI